MKITFIFTWMASLLFGALPLLARISFQAETPLASIVSFGEILVIGNALAPTIKILTDVLRATYPYPRWRLYFIGQVAAVGIVMLLEGTAGIPVSLTSTFRAFLVGVVTIAATFGMTRVDWDADKIENESSAWPSQRVSFLRKFMEESMDLDELKTLAFELGIPVEGAPTKSDFIRQVLTWARHRRKMESLAQWIEEARPDVGVI